MTFRVSKTGRAWRRSLKKPSVPVDDVIDKLWLMLVDVALDDADAYETLRQAIAHLEQARRG